MRAAYSIAALLLLLLPGTVLAQGYRAEVRVYGMTTELQALEPDSLPESAVPGSGLRRTLEDGTIAGCIPGGFCRWYRSGAIEDLSLVTQDVRVSSWTGIEGLAAHAHVRGRYGSNDNWPRTEQDLEAVTAYLSYEQPSFRVRAGRQYQTNGLGFSNFDGASLRWRGFRDLRIDLYGGWSLAPGLNAPRDGDLLSDAVDFPTDKRGVVLGVGVTGRLGDRGKGSVVYQREIRSDRLGLYTERLATDARLQVGPSAVDLSVDYDLVFEEFNEALVRVTTPLATGTEVVGQLRHYTPHFELWTIWAAFSPVGYNEGRVSVAWKVPVHNVRVEGGLAYRGYEETDAGADFVRVEDDAWTGFGRAGWRAGEWFVDGGYRAERGSGAARYGGDVRLGRRFGPDAQLAIHGVSTQSFSEFRRGEQLTNGGGVNGSIRWRDITVSGSWAVYSISFDARPRVSDWTQNRASLGIAYAFGSDPRSSSYGRDR